MLSPLHPHRCCDWSNTYKCWLCEMGGLDGKAFKEILYMILHNGEQMSLRHHPASCGKVIFEMIKKKEKKVYFSGMGESRERAPNRSHTLF